MFSKLAGSLLTRDRTSFALTVTQHFDLCLAWNWDYDRDFVRLLESACEARGLTFLQITPHTLEQNLLELKNCQRSFRVFIDRASDSDERFLYLVEWARGHRVVPLNPFRMARQAWSKAEMDIQFNQAGLNTPAAIVLPSYCDEPVIPPVDLDCLGGKFAIKPAHGGGGQGVQTGATCWEQVSRARQEYPADQYLLQAHVEPALFGSRPAWFRVIHLNGLIFPCWWEPCSHRYTPISRAEEFSLCLKPLWTITRAIGQICRLELFSTEIALTSQGQFMVVDHVNDPIDLRLQSRTPDGIPDEIVKAIAEGLADLALKYR